MKHLITDTHIEFKLEGEQWSVIYNVTGRVDGVEYLNKVAYRSRELTWYEVEDITNSMDHIESYFLPVEEKPNGNV